MLGNVLKRTVRQLTVGKTTTVSIMIILARQQGQGMWF